MSRWKAPAAGICVCFLVVIALLTILFVVMNRHPETNVDVSSTDMRLLDSVSTVWCGWQEVSASHPVTVYRVTGDPTNERSPSVNYHLNYNIKLHWGKERKLKYFLLSGSSLEVRACSSRPGIVLRVFQGLRKWKECQRLRNTAPFHHDADSSSSEESGEMRFGRNSMKEVLRNRLSRHGWYPPDCKEAMQNHKIASDKRRCKGSLFLLSIGHPDTYIFSLEDYHSSADESNTEIKIIVNRTQYNTRSALVVCRDATKCDVPLSFGANERSVVSVAQEPDAGAVTYMVIAKCKPRVFFFIFLFAFIPLLLLLCIGCVIFCFRKRAQKKPIVKYIQVTNNEQVNTPSQPLLSGPEVTIYSRTNQPPSYPESTAPPPYSPGEAPQSRNKQRV